MSNLNAPVAGRVGASKEIQIILDRIRSNNFNNEYHAEQIKQMLIEVRYRKHGKGFIFYNLKDITGGDFPLHYAMEMRMICNEVLVKGRIDTDEEFINGIATA